MQIQKMSSTFSIDVVVSLLRLLFFDLFSSIMKSLSVFFLSFVLTCVFTSAGFSDVTNFSEDKTLIDFDQIWFFNDSDQDLGSDWRQVDYDDSSWSRGAALLGYDTNNRRNRWPAPGLQTMLTENLNTYYFRKSFDYQGSHENLALRIEQIIDDAAVYYLNGEEIARSELMPEGSITHSTRAIRATDPWRDNETLMVMNPPLRQGRNVFAVSVHNQNPSSSDICFGVKVSVGSLAINPPALYLTWQQDPTTTMTIHWHTQETVEDIVLQYQPASGGELTIVPAKSKPMVFSDRIVHTVELTGLQPNADYRFRVAVDDSKNFSPYYLFRTMPTTAESPIRIALGGDVRHRRDWMAEVNREATRFDPHFIVWGGDLAYADGLKERVGLWYEFFDVMLDTLVTPAGRVIPVIFGIGNHEIVGHFYWGANRGRDSYIDSDDYREMISPYYYNLFAFPGHPGYGVLDFADYMSIILLDTDHSGPVEGKQTEWLAKVLAERTHIPNVFPVYHYPAFPSVRPYSGDTPVRIRQNWTPLFEQYGVELAFENHDHAYKRTVPVLRESEQPGGIIYFGDGAWGVGERVPREPSQEWYLERTMSMRHLILLALQDDSRDIKIISREGNIIDHFIDRVGERAQQR
jgi:hypothetical protein